MALLTAFISLIKSRRRMLGFCRAATCAADREPGGNVAPTKLYRIAGWSYAAAVALFAVALASGNSRGEITSDNLWLGILCFALPCSFYAYTVLRRFRAPRNFPMWMFVVIACYTGVVLFFSFEIGLLLAVPLVLAASASERDKRMLQETGGRAARTEESRA